MNSKNIYSGEVLKSNKLVLLSNEYQVYINNQQNKLDNKYVYQAINLRGGL